MCEEAIFDVVYQELEPLNLDCTSAKTYAMLLSVVTERLERDEWRDGVTLDAIQVQLAMAILGPRSGVPGEELCEALEGLAARYCGRDEASRLRYADVLDLTAAFGCGWGRDVADGAGWRALWPGAFMYLQGRVERAVATAYRALERQLNVQFPPDDPVCNRDAAVQVCTMLVCPAAPVLLDEVLEIAAGDKIEGGPGVDEAPELSGEVQGGPEADLTVTTDCGREEHIPPGAGATYSCTEGRAEEDDEVAYFEAGEIIRLKSSDTRSLVTVQGLAGRNRQRRLTHGQRIRYIGHVGLEAWACSCGKNDCSDLHRLKSWDPEGVHSKLQNFLYRAVYGHMTQIRARSFAASLLGSCWAREGWGAGARLRLARVRRYVCLSEDSSTLKHGKDASRFLTSRCSHCGSVAGNGTPVTEDEFLVAVNTNPPVWKLSEFWTCGQADCLVPGYGERTKIRAPDHTALSKAANACDRCGGAFFSTAQLDALKRDLRGAQTLLQGAKYIEKVRGESRCRSCGQRPRAAIVHCGICKARGRSGRLSDAPSWLFEPCAESDVEAGLETESSYREFDADASLEREES